MQWNKITIFIILLLLESCVEPFFPEIKEYEDLLFIEAIITNDPEISSRVLISRSIPPQSLEGNYVNNSDSPVSGASITIYCDDGSEYPYYEEDSGIYLPLDDSFIGEIGNSYRIVINHSENIYESEFDILRQGTDIDSISAKYKQKKTSDNGVTVEGLQFMVSTHDDHKEYSFYRWLLDATFYYSVPFNSTHMWINEHIIEYDNQGIMSCWKNKNIKGIFISTSDGLEENRIIEAPLNFESQYGDELSLRYSLHAKQLEISKEVYKFWSDLDKLIYRTGGLYETQPFRLEGNIKCTTDPGKNVLGIFEVAAVTEARNFFNRPTKFDIYQTYCSLDTVGTQVHPWSELENGTILIEVEQNKLYVTAPAICFDCRERGGTIERPPFWQ